jgi:hypothetical protein
MFPLSAINIKKSVTQRRKVAKKKRKKKAALSRRPRKNADADAFNFLAFSFSSFASLRLGAFALRFFNIDPRACGR